MFRKYQKAEGFAHLSKEEHQAVQEELRKVGKTSMVNADSEEREAISRMLNEGSPER